MEDKWSSLVTGAWFVYFSSQELASAHCAGGIKKSEQDDSLSSKLQINIH